ncbi:hypothetical protein CLV59_101177 [Chitinophaga dinghuensis]|uniref:Uncharacterized protein n=1 Tax=Chitinophaga dinghuensis TaxID=1539050 RepID=A0A327W9P1_9BACT|nr:hypothetical protein [Chitinophaga dinghuensis]RAJ87427.1 hypothetical protein CLV59_101177 [Chitinophaga dinghuensis]
MNEQTAFPPVPEWKPDLPVDIDQILEKVKYYTDEKIQFAIFKNGTVTYFGEEVENIRESAVAILEQIFNYHPDFAPRFMDDRNIIIEYSQPAFTLVFEEEINQHWDYIEANHQKGICKDEVLVDDQGRQNVFDRIGKICLFGRAQMFMDAQAPEVVKIFEPRKA